MQTQDGLKRELELTMDELRKLAGEIRVQLHLASMDAKDKWNRELEPKLYSFEKNMEREVSAVSHDALRELRGAFRSFRDSLAKQRH